MLDPIGASESTPVLVELDRRTFIDLRKAARDRGATLGDVIRQTLRDQLRGERTR
jgi:hypothetical protein